MAYLSTGDVKQYLGVAGTAEDSLIGTLIVAAQAAIDSYCDRTFEAGGYETRTFDVTTDTEAGFLYLNADLCQIVNITNGDPAATVLGAAAYMKVPKEPPHLAILLRGTSGVAWQGEIQVTGYWAYSLSPPASIVQAMREYVGYLYRSYDQQADPQQARRTNGMPTHVKQLLEGYRRLR